MIRKYLILIVYLVVLIVFSVYVILDTLVFTTIYQVVDSNDFANEISIDNSTISKNITDSSYEDENISITIDEYYEYNTKIYVADIILKSSEYLKTAFASNSYGKNVVAKTSDIASLNNAILAVNGDYYGVREAGYVIRNGVIYRSSGIKNQEDLVIYEDGSFSIINESDISAEELVKNGAQQVFSFGPGLVDNSKIIVNTEEEVGKAMASNPRTAIGFIDKNHYIFVVSDGRTSESRGLSLYQLASFLKDYGVKQAYNLDGGGSSTMVFSGKVINNPTTNGTTIKERSVSDIVYIGY